MILFSKNFSGSYHNCVFTSVKFQSVWSNADFSFVCSAKLARTSNNVSFIKCVFISLIQWMRFILLLKTDPIRKIELFHKNKFWFISTKIYWIFGAKKIHFSHYNEQYGPFEIGLNKFTGERQQDQLKTEQHQCELDCGSQIGT